MHRRILALAVALTTFAARSEAQSPRSIGPQAQAEALGRAYADAVNREEALEAYMRLDAEPVSPGVIRNFFEDQRWINGGGVDFVAARARPSTPVVIEAVVRTHLYGALQGVEFTLSPGPNPRVTLFVPVAAPAWALTIPAPASQREVAGRITRLMEKACRADLFSGAVLVAWGEQVLVQQACGEASRRYHAPNTVETRFNLGSMDKMFTAVAAMQLAEAGKLSLDATLDHYLDASWLDPEVARKVTVWQLMTHTSGVIPDVTSLAEAQPRTQFRELDEYKSLTHQVGLSFAPGSQFAYSNTGMVLLGAVIAKTSGEDYYAYIRAHILQPSGMAATGSFASDDPVENLATGYIHAPGSPYGWRENTTRLLLRGVPAGEGYSNLTDLRRFALALQAGKLLSPAAVRRLWTDHNQAHYGAGFEIEHSALGMSAGHSGFFRGVSTRMRLYSDRGFLVIVLSNIDRAGPPLVDAIEEQLLALPAR
ncbi:serine hydrolase domain-containing protein [Phenylobacterium sp.]|jgi:CubicO group peptidase (beta-lactamase class C family)|uniref:serine hydrolase domain-containing protein n=1 Tax=Phenylobacterium sp. TaxID=1871053 RepID=UPI002F425EDD